MPSPFPGMDPYLEDPALYSEFHGGLTHAIRTDLNRVLPKGYVARMDRYLWVADAASGGSVLLGAPDTYVHGPHEVPPGGSRPQKSTAPATVVWPVRRRRGNYYVRIIDPRDRRVVSVIEILSPANKRGSYRRAYRRKRSEYLARGVNLVEMDFLRTGRRLPVGQPPPARSDYYVLVTRAAEMPQGDFWPITVRDPLPDIPIPLDPGVPEVSLSLRQAMDRVYEECRFAEEVDYAQEPNPPLRGADATWARELLAHRPR